MRLVRDKSGGSLFHHNGAALYGGFDGDRLKNRRFFIDEFIRLANIEPTLIASWLQISQAEKEMDD